MMIARRVALVAAAAFGLAACTEVTQQDMPAELVFATFASPNIPAPNDLVLRAAATLPASAQKEFLQTFVDAGGFPSDQEVKINIPFNAVTWDAAAREYVAADAPTIDPATVGPTTVTLLELDGTSATPVEYDVDDVDPGTAGIQTAPGVLTLRKRADATGARRWDAGARYAYAVRGGASGVKTTEGRAISASSAIALAIPNRDLTKKENQPLGAIPDSNENGTNEDEIALLENVRKALWSPVNWRRADPGVWSPDPTAPMIAPFQAIATVWPVGETATIAAFNAAPGTVALIDAGAGVVPLPIDLLRAYGPTGLVVNNPAFGSAAGGLATLDGFSTTAMLMAQTSNAIDASTVHGGNVHLFRISGGVATEVPEYKAVAGGGGDVTTAGYIAQPPPTIVAQGTACPIAGGCSRLIALQPAVPVSATLSLPPLRSNTTYAVVITRRVKDVAGNGLAKTTAGKILVDLTSEPATGTPGDTTGTSTLSGVSDATARQLRDMRADLAPVWTALPEGTTKADVALAYTFKTQTVQSTSLRLAAAPYSIEAGAGAAIFTPSAATAVTPPAPFPGVVGWYEVTFNSLDGIDKTTGAFRPTLANDLATNPAALLAPLKALVAVPDPANVPNNCPAPADALKCAPLVIVGHGLNGSRTIAFAVASSLAAQGYVAAAIDFPLHGERNWCRSNADCTTGEADGTCTPFEGGAGQGDATPPGVCTDGSVPKTDASHYFVSANFFRMRDAFRQNVIDQSALGLALARPPSPLAPQPAGNPFASAAAGLGVAVNPAQIFYEGVSLGSIAGTQVVATNPRITRASLAVGGGTFADIATNSPTFRAQLEPLFASLIPGFTWDKVDSTNAAFDPVIAASYAKTLHVAKWILDPGEAVNYGLHVAKAPLPNLLANPDGSVAQSPKATLGLISFGDTVVPNGQNFMLYNLIGSTQVTYTSNLPDHSVPHGIIGALTADLAGAAGAQVRSDAAGWLSGVAPPDARELTLQ